MMNAHPTETISMASMPLVPQTVPMAVLHNQVPQLMEKEGMPLDTVTVPIARKSLNFGEAQGKIVVYDTAVQMVNMASSDTAQGAVGGSIAGTSLQTCRVVCHTSAVKCSEQKQLQRVFLPVELAKGKQFQPCSPPINKKEYPISRFIADTQFVMLLCILMI